MSKVDVIIMAGAPADPDMCAPGEKISRAMINIAGKTMIQWIMDALNSSETICRKIAVGDVAADGLDEVVKPGSGFLDNLMLGLERCQGADRVLVMTSDIPMLTPEAVDDYVNRAIDSGGDMCYPIVTQKACLEKYPHMKRTYLKTAEGMFTGGNMMILGTEFLKRNQGLITEAYNARKNPVKLASMIGLGFLFRLVLAQVLAPSLLPIPMLEKSLSKALKCKIVAIRTDYPEIGADVDKPSDLAEVQTVLSDRG
ncbi:MAG: nucleotidyltransferase family protein [Armatimonadota bacterium]